MELDWTEVRGQPDPRDDLAWALELGSQRDNSGAATGVPSFVDTLTGSDPCFTRPPFWLREGHPVAAPQPDLLRRISRIAYECWTLNRPDSTAFDRLATECMEAIADAVVADDVVGKLAACVADPAERDASLTLDRVRAGVRVTTAPVGPDSPVGQVQSWRSRRGAFGESLAEITVSWPDGTATTHAIASDEIIAV